ncbi:MAG: hypothetical protein HC836_12595 [Richelia sp. RM2_1_2]|nr:hypothetical protein [Richelia sp. RM2_1_2]
MGVDPNGTKAVIANRINSLLLETASPVTKETLSSFGYKINTPNSPIGFESISDASSTLLSQKTKRDRNLILNRLKRFGSETVVANENLRVLTNRGKGITGLFKGYVPNYNDDPYTSLFGPESYTRRSRRRSNARQPAQFLTLSEEEGERTLRVLVDSLQRPGEISKFSRNQLTFMSRFLDRIGGTGRVKLTGSRASIANSILKRLKLIDRGRFSKDERFLTTKEGGEGRFIALDKALVGAFPAGSAEQLKFTEELGFSIREKTLSDQEKLAIRYRESVRNQVYFEDEFINQKNPQLDLFDLSSFDPPGAARRRRQPRGLPVRGQIGVLASDDYVITNRFAPLPPPLSSLAPPPYPQLQVRDRLSRLGFATDKYAQGLPVGSQPFAEQVKRLGNLIDSKKITFSNPLGDNSTIVRRGALNIGLNNLSGDPNSPNLQASGNILRIQELRKAVDLFAAQRALSVRRRTFDPDELISFGPDGFRSSVARNLRGELLRGAVSKKTLLEANRRRAAYPLHGGYVPNYTQISAREALNLGLDSQIPGLAQAISREITGTGVSINQARVNFSNSNSIPPVSVTNTRDEGVFADPRIGINRVRKLGGNPALAGSGREFLPNFINANIISNAELSKIFGLSISDIEKLRNSGQLQDLINSGRQRQLRKFGSSSGTVSRFTQEEAARRFNINNNIEAGREVEQREIARSRRQQILGTAGFAVSFAGGALSQSFSDPQSQRAVSGVSNAVGIGATIASLTGGPIGTTIGLAVASIGSVVSAMDTLTPNFDEVAAKSQKLIEAKQDEVNSITEFIRAQSQLNEVIQSGGDERTTRIAQRNVSNLLNEIPNINLRRELISARDIIGQQEVLSRVQEDARREGNLQTALASIAQFEVKSSGFIRQSSLNAITEFFGLGRFENPLSKQNVNEETIRQLRNTATVAFASRNEDGSIDSSIIESVNRRFGNEAIVIFQKFFDDFALQSKELGAVTEATIEYNAALSNTNKRVNELSQALDFSSFIENRRRELDLNVGLNNLQNNIELNRPRVSEEVTLRSQFIAQNLETRASSRIKTDELNREVSRQLFELTTQIEGRFNPETLSQIGDGNFEGAIENLLTVSTNEERKAIEKLRLDLRQGLISIELEAKEQNLIAQQTLEIQIENSRRESKANFLGGSANILQRNPTLTSEQFSSTAARGFILNQTTGVTGFNRNRRANSIFFNSLNRKRDLRNLQLPIEEAAINDARGIVELAELGVLKLGDNEQRNTNLKNRLESGLTFANQNRISDIGQARTTGLSSSIQNNELRKTVNSILNNAFQNQDFEGGIASLNNLLSARSVGADNNSVLQEIIGELNSTFELFNQSGEIAAEQSSRLITEQNIPKNIKDISDSVNRILNNGPGGKIDEVATNTFNSVIELQGLRDVLIASSNITNNKSRRKDLISDSATSQIQLVEAEKRFASLANAPFENNEAFTAIRLALENSGLNRALSNQGLKPIDSLNESGEDILARVAELTTFRTPSGGGGDVRLAASRFLDGTRGVDFNEIIGFEENSKQLSEVSREITKLKENIKNQQSEISRLSDANQTIAATLNNGTSTREYGPFLPQNTPAREYGPFLPPNPVREFFNNESLALQGNLNATRSLPLYAEQYRKNALNDNNLNVNEQSSLKLMIESLRTILAKIEQDTSQTAETQASVIEASIQMNGRILAESDIESIKQAIEQQIIANTQPTIDALAAQITEMQKALRRSGNGEVSRSISKIPPKK